MVALFYYALKSPQIRRSVISVFPVHQVARRRRGTAPPDGGTGGRPLARPSPPKFRRDAIRTCAYCVEGGPMPRKSHFTTKDDVELLRWWRVWLQAVGAGMAETDRGA